MTTLSKEEYLKKYLNPVESGDYKKKKKKRGEKVKIGRGMKIVDDDVSWSTIAPKEDENDFPDALVTQDEKPQVEVIDNRTKEEKAMDAYSKSDKWRSLAADKEDMENGEISDDDLEVSRAERHKSPKRTKQSTRHDSDSDIDLPRARNKSPEISRKSRHDSDSDIDLPRARNKSPEISRKSRHDSDSDNDVPRKRDPGDRTRRRTGPGSDIGVKRKERSKNKNSEKAEFRKRHDSSSDSDLDIPRSKNSQRSSQGQNSKRKESSDSDMDLPRARKGRQPSDSDLDIPRPKKDDASRRKGGAVRMRHDSGSSEEDPKAKAKKKALMISGGVGGLTSRSDLKREMEEQKKLESNIDKLAKDSQKNKTVYREKGGKKRDLKKEQEIQKQEDAVKRKKMEKYDRWGKGEIQDSMKSNALDDLIHESNKPLARYRDDADLDAFQRSTVRDGDPMAEYLAKKRKKENANVPSLPKYRGPTPPPNRYHIPPGYRWDGVDRSNGFEKKYYLSLSSRTALKEESYKWSVEDM